MCFLIYYKMRNKQNITEQDKGTETNPIYSLSFYTSMILLQCITLAFKNFLSNLLRHNVLFIIIKVLWISNYTFHTFYILFYYAHFRL
jgi:hypothetical protein